MGRVWRATDVVLHREVAIKELVPPPGLTPAERQEMRERSLREARAIARLNNINVVRVFDVLRTDADPWIVMEYVPSRSLQDTLAADGPYNPVRTAEIGLGVLNALKAAHRAGVVHRDIKPGNVLIGGDGRVVLTDFGLATVPGDPNVTRTGLVLGSPAYIAPERARDGTAGPAADLWSLGATLYAAVEGQSPFARPSAIATLAALATENVPQARNAGPLKPVLNGLLRKDPAHRIDADEAERLLARAAGRRTKISFPMSPTMRRPGAGRERPSLPTGPGGPPVLPGSGFVTATGSAPVVPTPRPPVTARPGDAPNRSQSGPNAVGNNGQGRPTPPGRPGFTPGRATVGNVPPAPPAGPGQKPPLDPTRVDGPPVRDEPPGRRGPADLGGARGPAAPPGLAQPGNLAGTRGPVDPSRPRQPGTPFDGRGPANPAGPRQPGDPSGARGPVTFSGARPASAAPGVPGRAAPVDPSADHPAVNTARVGFTAADVAANRRKQAAPEHEASLAAATGAYPVVPAPDEADKSAARAETAQPARAETAQQAEAEAVQPARTETTRSRTEAAQPARREDAQSRTEAARPGRADAAPAGAEAEQPAPGEAPRPIVAGAETPAAEAALVTPPPAEPAKAGPEVKGEAEQSGKTTADAVGKAAAKSVAGKATIAEYAAEPSPTGTDQPGSDSAARAGSDTPGTTTSAETSDVAAGRVAAVTAAEAGPAKNAGSAEEPAAAEQAEPAEAAEPAEKAESAEKTQPAEKAEPAEKTQPAVKAEPGPDRSAEATPEPAEADTEKAEAEQPEPEQAARAEAARAEEARAEQARAEAARAEKARAEAARAEKARAEAARAEAARKEAARVKAEQAKKPEPAEAPERPATALTPGRRPAADQDKTSVVDFTAIVPPTPTPAAEPDGATRVVNQLPGVPGFTPSNRPAWNPMPVRPEVRRVNGVTIFGTTLTRRQAIVGASIVLVFVLLVGIILVQALGDDGDRTAGSGGTTPAAVSGSEQPAAPPAKGGAGSAAPAKPSSAPSSAAATTGAVPAGWKTRSLSGYSLALPSNAEVEKRGSGGNWIKWDNRLLIVFRFDGDQGDPAKAFQQASPPPGYQKIGIKSVTYQGRPAADWEYLYNTDSGSRQRVLKRGFSVDGKTYNICWYTPPDEWDSARKDLDGVLAGFKAG
ncbi:hypothetical protein Asi03nite_39320 [Actinoplanes siamensis]|uniref:Protein kinase domain-containing protein n=2 Tax=Actinoplanes siamensis TaxID=1223317 RepID=A0A919N8F1_9ACTN|nr:hypothetical protein Asi03nite_39320 [Actinoplanes siamensis]